MEGNSSFLKSISAALYSLEICLITATEFDIQFHVYVPYDFDKFWYSLITSILLIFTIK